MAKVVLDVPGLWADHHVLMIRDALLKNNGVEQVYASSAWSQVLVDFDQSKTDSGQLEKQLQEIGFTVGDGGVPIVAEPTENRKDPAWREAIRVTETNEVDLMMSGEFRRY